jgi:hypothetical protein
VIPKLTDIFLGIPGYVLFKIPILKMHLITEIKIGAMTRPK